MKTSALILMITTNLVVIAFTAYFFRKVLAGGKPKEE